MRARIFPHLCILKGQILRDPAEGLAFEHRAHMTCNSSHDMHVIDPSDTHCWPMGTLEALGKLRSAGSTLLEVPTLLVSHQRHTKNTFAAAFPLVGRTQLHQLAQLQYKRPDCVVKALLS
jgi:hypothetical protein